MRLYKFNFRHKMCGNVFSSVLSKKAAGLYSAGPVDRTKLIFSIRYSKRLSPVTGPGSLRSVEDECSGSSAVPV